MKKGSTNLLTPRSRRSLTNACRIAGIPYDPHAIKVVDLGVLFLNLLVAGIDHTYVGCPGWWDAIFRDAPTEARVHGS